MIETSSVLPRKSSVIFGNLWAFSGIFGNDRLAFGQLLENIRKSAESVQKLRKIVMGVCRYGISFLVFNLISHSLAVLDHQISS